MKEVGFNSGDVLSLSFVVSVAVIVIVGNSMHWGAFCAFIAHCHKRNAEKDLRIELDFNCFAAMLTLNPLSTND